MTMETFSGPIDMRRFNAATFEVSIPGISSRFVGLPKKRYIAPGTDGKLYESDDERGPWTLVEEESDAVGRSCS